MHSMIWYYVTVIASMNIVSHFLSRTTGYNLWLVPISGLVALFFFSNIYLSHLLKEQNKWFGRMILGIQGMILLHLIYVINQIDPSSFHAQTVVYCYLVIVLLSIRYYWRMLSKEIPLDRSNFIFNSVVLVYFMSSTLFFVTTNFLINESLYLVAPFWIGYSIITLCFYIYITHKLWQHGKTQNTSLVG